jgi:hypothetical protein
LDFIRRLRQKTRGNRLQTYRQFVAEVRRRNAIPASVPLRLVDLGGTVAFWENWWRIGAQDGFAVTLINNHEVDQSQKHRTSSAGFITNLNRDATALTADFLQQFDLIFSNSFFEHLGDRTTQAALAEKIIASGRPYFIQVPNKNSPVDPHHPFAPFFALLPFSLRSRLLTVASFRPGEGAVSLAEARRWQGRYAPLGRADMRSLFPDAVIALERPFGVPMSILASRGLKPGRAAARAGA